MAWCCGVGTPVLLWQYTGQQSDHTDTTKARLLLLHPHLLSSLVGPRGPPNKVGLTELKLRLNFTDTEASKNQAGAETSVLCY